jgi:hypothetical protein
MSRRWLQVSDAQVLALDGSPVQVHVQTPEQQQLEQQFEAAMAAPESEIPPPPRAEPLDPEAPYGRKADGTPKRGPGGRPPKAKRAEEPRVTSTPPAAAGVGGPVRDYGPQLDNLAGGVWNLLAMLPPTQAQAAIFKVHRPGLVYGLNLAAQQNEKVRAGVDWLTAESWLIALGMVMIPFTLQSISLWTGGDAQLREQLQAATIRDLQQMQAEQEAAFRAAAGLAAA